MLDIISIHKTLANYYVTELYKQKNTYCIQP